VQPFSHAGQFDAVGIDVVGPFVVGFCHELVGGGGVLEPP
jgi:hypothetical protein